ncbi:MAG: tandem-95 repeat protein [Gammaproteobacteria bacterium]|nr:tandem-95 repeat protein [Gammaproteobacteria bacterium]
MKKLAHCLGAISIAFLLAICLIITIKSTAASNYEINACTPAISLIDVPPYGSFNNLQGQADCINDPANYRVTVYIYVAGWWTKPYLNAPLTVIQPDGTWTTDITTGGNDEEATKIAAFLLPVGYTPPLMNGGAPLPADLFTNAADYTHVERTARELDFNGRTWRVKDSDYLEGPGPNYFSDDPQDVWVDGAGKLHMRIAHRSSVWYSSEVITEEPLGYGLYTFHVLGPIDQLNENIVLGLFTWDSVAPPDAYSREVDVEFSRWGNPAAVENAQYVLQPWNQPGNRHPFSLTLPVTESLHLFDWQPDFVRFASYQGNQPLPGNLLHTWVYTGSDIPVADDSNGRINLWLVNGVPPSDGQEVEIVVEAFTHTPRQTAIHVASGGSDQIGCGSTVWPCATIPYALHLAQTNDAIQVAEGTYTGTVVLTKSVQLLGGYDPISWTRDITNHITSLDGLDAGPVIQITNGSTATVEGFHITNGQASYGAGIYISSASPTVSHNHIYGNAATFGGGIYATNSDNNAINDNNIYQNTASSGGGMYLTGGTSSRITNNQIHNHTTTGSGGGIYIASGFPILQNNQITDNQVTGYYHGAGIYIGSGTPFIISNTIATNNALGWGGGVYIGGGTPFIGYNNIHHNQAGRSWYTGPTGGGIQVEGAYGGAIHHNHIHHNTVFGRGGGVFLKSATTVADNLIEYNSAAVGGGISVWGSSAAGTISRNVIQHNNGEGIHLWYWAHPTVSFNRITNQNDSGIFVENVAYPVIDGNVIMSNTAPNGGGIRVQGNAAPTLRNNAIVSNTAATAGSGIYISAAFPQLRHNTISGNSGGDGSGIYVANATINTLLNSIVANQAVGIVADSGGTVMVDGVLWHNNGANTGGLGSVTVANAYGGNPSFAADGYHLLPSSPAVDLGINAGVTGDIDGETRPAGSAPDLGADELYVPPASLVLTGPASGETAQSYTFTATVFPTTTTTPLDYWWQASGQSPITHTGGLTNTAVFTWNVPGVKHITVTAANNGGMVTGTHTIAITTSNHPPTAGDDTAITPEDTPVAILALANDSDPDGDPLTIVTVGSPLHGTAGTDGLTVVYTPTLNYHGQDVFAYTISDGVLTDTAVITVTVSPVNDQPAAANDTAVTDEDTAVTIPVLDNDFDPDGDALTIVGVGVPANGVAHTNGATVVYTPTLNFNGQDVFTYTISDGLLTDMAVVTITVNPINDPPEAVADTANTPEDTTRVVTVLGNDSDPDGDVLTVTAVSDPVNGTAVTDGAVVTYTPALNFNGQDVFAYTISDGVLTDTAVVTVTVGAVNDLPVAHDDVASTDEDTAVTIPVLDNDFDPDGDTLAIIGIGAPANGVAHTDGITVVYTPTLNFNAQDIFTYTITDGDLTDTAFVTITVTAVNDPPIAVDDTANTPEDTPRNIVVLGNDSDPDGDVLLVTAVSDPAHGTAVTDGSLVTYTPDVNFNGLDFITYVVSDGVLTDTAVITVTVGAVNDTPIAVDDTAETDEDTAVTIPVLVNDSDPDGDTLVIADVGAAQHGAVSLTGTAVTYTPNPDFYGTDTFTYTISDGALMDTAVVTITIRPVNDAPVAVDDTAVTDMGTAVTIPVLNNDSDPDGDVLTITTLGLAQNGVVHLAGTAVVYTPTTGFFGTDTFTYTISDGALTATAVVTITVNQTMHDTLFLPMIINNP